METSIVTPDNRKILTVKLRRETSRVSTCHTQLIIVVLNFHVIVFWLNTARKIEPDTRVCARWYRAKDFETLLKFFIDIPE